MVVMVPVSCFKRLSFKNDKKDPGFVLVNTGFSTYERMADYKW